MTLDTLILAIGATIYLYVGTYHQDLRGLRIIGRDWETYRNNTSLLFPSPSVLKRMFSDLFAKEDMKHVNDSVSDMQQALETER